MLEWYREILSVIAIGLTFVAFFPYIRSIHQGRSKPHVFSWLLWGSTTLVVFGAQLADGGGAGAWPIGVSGLVTLYVAGLAYSRRADVTITRSDWAFFISALTALPLWYVTADPLAAVIVLTAVDLLGFAPTFRKSIDRPFDEELSFFVLMALRNMIAIAALEHLSLTTALFPAATGAACLVLIGAVMRQREQLSREDRTPD